MSRDADVVARLIPEFMEWCNKKEAQLLRENENLKRKMRNAPSQAAQPIQTTDDESMSQATDGEGATQTTDDKDESQTTDGEDAIQTTDEDAMQTALGYS